MTQEAVAETIVSQEKLSVLELALKGGWIMLVLALMFLLVVYVFAERCFVLHRAAKEQQNFMLAIRDYVYDGKLDAARALCERTEGTVARMIEKGLSRIGKPLNDINAAIETVGKQEVAKLEKNLSWLSTAAGAAPMIGFLGTVLGMVRVFFDMASKGNNIEVGTLADGMYQAMITTVGGLIVGIIAYILYNYLVARIEAMVNTFEARSSEFMDLLNEPIRD